MRASTQPSVVLPLEGRIEISVGKKTFELDRTSWATLPPTTKYAVRSKTPEAQVLTLMVGPRAMANAEREYRLLQVAELEKWFSTFQMLTRTQWVDELARRFIFEHHVCEKHDSEAARFLATEITKELYYACKEHLGSLMRAPTRTRSAKRPRAAASEKPSVAPSAPATGSAARGRGGAKTAKAAKTGKPAKETASKPATATGGARPRRGR